MKDKFDRERFERLLGYATTLGRRECSYDDALLVYRVFCGSSHAGILDGGVRYYLETRFHYPKKSEVVYDMGVLVDKGDSSLYPMNLGALLGAYVVFYENVLDRPAFEELAAACCGFYQDLDQAPKAPESGRGAWLDENGFFIQGRYEGISVNEAVRVDPMYVWRCYYSPGIRRIDGRSNENVMFRTALYGHYGIRGIKFRFSDIEYAIYDEDYLDDRFGHLE